jgi:hypothetical protein
MKGKLCCATAAVLIGSAVIGFAGPYSIHDHTLVKVDWSYQSVVSIGNIPSGVDSIEFSTDGFIYGVDTLNDTLVRIDPLNGQAETIGALGVDLEWVTDLDEDDLGQLWLLEGITGQLYSIDTTTGAATLRCEAGNPEIFGLAIDDGRFFTTDYPPDPPDPGCGLEYVSSYAFYLEKGPDGWIHGLSFYPFGFQYTVYVFFRVDPTTGIHEVLGEFGPNAGDYWGLTFDPTEQPPPEAGIPATGRAGTVILIALLAITGVAILTRVWTLPG